MAVGRADHVSYYAASRAPAPWPVRVGTPPAAARCFRARPALDDPRGPLVGTAGTGKTQQAAHLARRAWDEGRLDLLVWVPAGDREAVLACYAQAHAELTGTDTTAAPEQAAQAFLARLRADAEEPRPRWLIVLDGVADPEDLRGLWPPDHPGGRTLVTTRRRDIAQPGPVRAVVPVAGFTPAEGTAYLRDVLAEGGRDAGAEEAEALARELGLLPLALSQAAAQLVREGLDCTAYLGLLTRPGGRPLAELVPGPGALPDGQHFGVHEAWAPSCERAGRLVPGGLVGPLLELAALLPDGGAPASVLTRPAALRHLERHRTAPSPDGAAPRPEEVTAALRVLDRLGLVDCAAGDAYPSVRMHPVLRRVTREQVPAHRAGAPALSLASALAEAADRDPDDAGFGPVLAACTEELLRHAGTVLWTHPLTGRAAAPRRDTFSATMDAFFGGEPPLGVHPLLFRVGEFLGGTGRAGAARGHFERLAEEALRRQGPDSEVVDGARERAAHWRGEAGDPAGAAAAYAAMLGERIHRLGPEHLGTLATRAALGRWRAKAGDPGGAAAAYAELVPLQERHYGPAYPEVFANRALLAGWRGESGDAYGAAMAYQALLDDLLRRLGASGGPTLPRETFLGTVVTRPNWYDVFGAHFGHAHWRGRAGDPAGAAVSLGHLLAEQTRVLGPEHADTLATARERERWARYGGGG
ncbi:NB-ARC domain-containing protein [Streptomyces sp. NPDC047014]|uniref:NB-ARC domain-containing protein n=1 Tax=Streptomyces sp. NPDC047014 TaxID=3155736 RepID=UPI0034098A6E